MRIELRGRERAVGASIGVAPFGDREGETAERLLLEADLAMYRAKAAGRGRIEVCDEVMRAELAARAAAERERPDALAA